MTAPLKTINMIVAALGGEGGGVLTTWLIEVAKRSGWYCQSTSLAGVAQRTGATDEEQRRVRECARDLLAHPLDLLPTFASLAGADPVQRGGPIDGIDLSSNGASIHRVVRRDLDINKRFHIFGRGINCHRRTFDRSRGDGPAPQHN